MNLSIDDLKGNGASWKAKFFRFLAYGFSALTSFQFFSVFAGSMFTIAGNMSQALVGVLGMLFCEGGVVVWSGVRSKGCETEEQIGVAEAGFIGSLVISIAATVLYLGLTNELARNLIDDTVYLWVQRLSVGLIVVAMAGHVALVAAFDYFSAENQKSRADIQQKALRNKGTTMISTARTFNVVGNELQEWNRRMPDGAAIQARHNVDNDFKQSLPAAAGRPPVPSGSRGPGPSPNGRPKRGGPPRPGPKDGPQRP